MANDSIVTRPEVESRQRDNIAMRVGECAALNTITQLLERVAEEGQFLAVRTEHDVRAFLARYHARDTPPLATS